MPHVPVWEDNHEEGAMKRKLANRNGHLWALPAVAFGREDFCEGDGKAT